MDECDLNLLPRKIYNIEKIYIYNSNIKNVNIYNLCGNFPGTKINTRKRSMGLAKFLHHVKVIMSIYSTNLE